MKKLIKLLSIFIMIFSFSYLNANEKGIDIKELESLQKVGITVIDLRKQNKIDETGIIPGAYKLNFYKSNGTLNKLKWQNKFVNLVKGRNIKFVIISENGKLAKQLANTLYKEKRYQNSYYLNGGINNWLNKNKKTII